MIALVGHTGYIGQKFAAELDRLNQKWIPVYRRNISELYETLVVNEVDFLINCAGYTGKPNVDACEINKSECILGNVVLPQIIKTACEQADIPWGHISSGCIYDGYRKSWSELDIPNFTFNDPTHSFYSGCKALAESIIVDSRCYIWRLRIPFDGQNCPRNYLYKVQNYDKLLEVRNSLSYLPDFVGACIDCHSSKLPYGIYNMTNPGSVLTSDIVEALGRRVVTYYADTSEFMRDVTTPRSSCVLDCTKALKAGLHLRPVEEAIQEAVSEWRQNQV